MPSSIPRAAILLGIAGLGAGCGPSGPPRPRNLLFVCVDTLRADHLGALGAEPSPSPAIDAFAASAVLFERAYAHAPWTLPSFAAILTSLYSSTTGTWTKESRLGEDVTTLPERFREAGFDTYGIASHIFFRREFGLLQGFDGFDEEFCHKKGDAGWVEVTSPAVTEKAKRWLGEPERAERPWLLWLHYFDPHIPYVDHEGGASASDEQARYRSEIAFTDRHVGELLASLEHLGFADDTAVVFVSDHGEAFYEHPEIHRHGYSLFDEELRVPLAIRVPGVAPRRVSSLVRTLDLAPTLYELFGLPAEGPSEGRSFLDVLVGAERDAPPLLAELRLNDGFHARGVLDGRYKLVEDLSRGGVRLYDLLEDPRETRDLAAERPDVVRELSSRMEELEERAAELGSRYRSAGGVELPADVLEQLHELGYVGEGGVPTPEGVPEPGSEPEKP
jgi:choline-sulfatase